MQEKETVKKLKMKFTKDNFLILLLLGVLLLVIAWPVEDHGEKGQSESGKLDTGYDMLDLQTDSLQAKGDILTGSGGYSTANSQGSGGQIGSAGISQGEAAVLSYAALLESSLEELLGTMDGVGKVRVMVTLEGSGETVVEKDVGKERDGTTEVDSAGGSRNTTSINESEETIYLKGQGSSDIPYVRKVLSPQVTGVAVSAQGGGNARVAANITETLQALFGIEKNKIKVVKMTVPK